MSVWRAGARDGAGRRGGGGGVEEWAVVRGQRWGGERGGVGGARGGEWVVMEAEERRTKGELNAGGDELGENSTRGEVN